MTKRELFKHIKLVEDTFKEELHKKMNLELIKGPVIIDPSTGLNDDLSGKEKPLSFEYKDTIFEVVHSLAKWKRKALLDYDFNRGEGLFVLMNAIRPNESDLSKYHALHVDQYDWEKTIESSDRNTSYLENTVRTIFNAIKVTKEKLMEEVKELKHPLTGDVHFITSEELLLKYPDLSPEEREYAITKEYKVVFVKEIGHKLSDGERHGERAADYDDWDLNGDLIVWDEVNSDVLELSSMGIRVNHDSIVTQHEAVNATSKLEMPFHKSIISETLPLSIGGGIGRSRVNMFILERQDIVDVK